MFTYLTPCKILLFADMAAQKEKLAMQNNSNVYCLMSYQHVTKHVAKFKKTHRHTGTIFDCFFAYVLTLPGQGFEKLSQTGGGWIPPPLLTSLLCI